jgi:mRNA interferase RelE/StbE
VSYRISLSPRAERELDRLHGRIYARLQSAVSGLAANPRPPRCLKMTMSSEWRIRVGSYRIRYLIDDAAQEVTVTRIAHRREVYDF